MVKNSKQKGNNFERKVAKLLTEKLDMEFQRTPSSGGLHWTSDNNVYGDIVTPNDFPFIIECKNRENWSFDQFMKGKCKEFDNWVEQVARDCQKYNEDKNDGFKLPLIIFTKNRQPIYMAYDYIAIDYFEEKMLKKLWDRNSYINYKEWCICKLREG